MDRGNAGLLSRSGDRRDARRHNIRLAVRAVTSHGLSWLCQVTDFSAEAVSVRYPASREPAVRSWLDSGGDAIRLQFHHGVLDRWQTIQGHVVRSDPGLLIIRFAQDALRGFETLLAQSGLASPRQHQAPGVVPCRALSARARGHQADVAVRQVVIPPVPSLIEPETMRQQAIGGLSLHQAIACLYNPSEMVGNDFPGALVPELIRVMGKSPRMTARGRTLLEWLGPVIERSLARTPEALTSGGHTLRSLLNRIGHIETADHENPGPWPEAMLRVLRSPEVQDEQALAEAAAILRAEIQKRDDVHRRNLRRVTKAVAGSERLREAEAATNRALDKRLLGGPVPLAVLRFVENEWRNRLVLLHLHEGESGSTWLEALALLDAVLAYHALPDACSATTIRVRLEALCGDQGDSQSARNMLDTCLQETGVQELVCLSEGFAQDEGQQADDERLRQWRPALEGLPIGSWFMDGQDDQPPVRLAWTNSRHTRFVLVTPSGRKQYDLGLTEMADYLAESALTPVTRHDQSLVDEALGRLLEGLYERRIRNATTDAVTGLADREAFLGWLERVLHTAPLDREQALVVLTWDRATDAVALAGQLRRELGSDRISGRVGPRRIAFWCHREGLESWLVLLMQRCNALVAGGGNHVCAGVAVGDPAMVTAAHWYHLAEEAARQAPFEDPPALRFASISAERSRYIRRLVDRLAGNGRLRREELMLQAQRIIPLHGATRMSAQYELLMTLPDEDGNLMTAQELIPLAERFAGGRNLDEWLMQATLDCLSRPMQTLPEVEPGICIPVLGYTLTESGLVHFIHEVFRIRPCPVERLWFSISGADALADPDTVALFMREVRELGCRICLDADETDVGLAQLVRRLPVDLVRLRPRTSEEDGRGHDSRLAAVVTAAHQMGAEVIASGVSRPERVERLRELGLDYAQGDAIARPRLLPH
ncbi:DUF1631 family protein [Salicola sp. Rm-C-2C1-2]|uniref:DUF1631 family protein n=1 Tax=Salicola sp. Rm-C-2C1-2 TaxID=3141321 RepID=UPI0032E51F1A